ncbi:CBS domain-containing protein [Phyllobacterium endophyticum]|nr:CBS domain-containing protein [Phyllobacterium endophyticum]
MIILDDNGKYVGIVLVPEAHAGVTENSDEDKLITDLIRYQNDFLQPEMNAKQAARLFDETESEALAVVNDFIERRVVGLLTESHTLRRYSEELDRQRRSAAGEI